MNGIDYRRQYRFAAALVLAASLGIAIPVAQAAPDLANGKKIYMDKCARCHGASGKGDGPKAETLEKKPMDYTDKKKMAEHSDAQLKQAILEGKPPMPAYQGKISDKDLDDVVAHIRAFAR